MYHQDYDTKLQTLAVADDLPDLFWVGESGVKKYKDAGMLSELDSVIEEISTAYREYY